MTTAAHTRSFVVRLWEWTKSIVVALVVWFFLRTFLVEAFRIPSGSMENTLLIGDFLFVNKALYGAEVPIVKTRLPAVREPKRNDILVFDSVEEEGLKVVKRLLDTGVSLQNIRKAVDHLRNRGIKDLANVTLFSDGATVYECTSAEEVVDLLAGGQGVFGIAVSGALRELSGELAELPAERIDGGPVTPADDELSKRRRARAAV